MSTSVEDKIASMEQALQALEVKFTASLPEKIREIDAARTQFIAAPHSQDAYTLLYRLLHTLAGLAGTFNHTECGVKAKMLEFTIKPLLKGTVWSPKEVEDFSITVQSFVAEFG